ncbi:hypothetical protein GKC56_00590 [Neisseriaceae bacterium PsAf]|nr:hypothetical protein [Neisseriaceae bacterium PsAf]MCV2503254.1 hypothetical protein [Neisseriaceae bacterium]
MLKKHWLLLPLIGLTLSACQTPQSHSTTNKNAKPKITKTVPTRVPSNETPLKTIPSKFNAATAQNCIKNNMLTYLGIPPQFVGEIELTDHSNIVILQNPYSNSEGVYVRIIKNSPTNSTLELYKNGIQFVSKRWYQLLDVCK